MLGKEQAVPENLTGPKELDFTIRPHDAAAPQCVNPGACESEVSRRYSLFPYSYTLESSLIPQTALELHGVLNSC